MCLVGHNGWAGPAGRHGASAARGVLHIGRVGWEGSCRRWPSPAPFRTSAVPAAGAAPVKACPVSTVPETRRAGPGERWPGGPDRRTGSIATHQREPTTKVPRGASLGPRKISIGPARHRPAACGIARPQRARLGADLGGVWHDQGAALQLRPHAGQSPRVCRAAGADSTPVRAGGADGTPRGLRHAHRAAEARRSGDRTGLGSIARRGGGAFDESASPGPGRLLRGARSRAAALPRAQHAPADPWQPPAHVQAALPGARWRLEPALRERTGEGARRKQRDESGGRGADARPCGAR
jgi:hypothetical protein